MGGDPETRPEGGLETHCEGALKPWGGVLACQGLTDQEEVEAGAPGAQSRFSRGELAQATRSCLGSCAHLRGTGPAFRGWGVPLGSTFLCQFLLPRLHPWAREAVRAFAVPAWGLQRQRSSPTPTASGPTTRHMASAPTGSRQLTLPGLPSPGTQRGGVLVPF